MPRRRPDGAAAGFARFRPRSFAGLLTRILIALLAIVAATTAIRTSAAGIFGNAHAQRAFGWAPQHAGLNARVAELLVNAGRAQEARPFAFAALRREPTNVAALRALALAAEADGNGREATRLFQLAHAMSRRDRATEAWLLRESIRTGDFAAAVSHFDISMRIAARGNDQFLPILVAATADPRMLVPLRRQLEQDPQWKPAFLQRLAYNGPRPDHSVALSRGLLDPTDEEEGGVLRTLIESLVNVRRPDLAWLLYRDVRPGITAPQAAPYVEQRFDPSAFPPFDWKLVEDPDLGAQTDARPDGGAGQALLLLARNGASGYVARRLIRLSPGAYVVEYDSGALAGNAFERPQVSLHCLGVDAPIVNSRPDWSGPNPRRARASFTIPANCAWQSLGIAISAGEEDAADRPWIANLSIRRAG